VFNLHFVLTIAGRMTPEQMPFVTSWRMRYCQMNICCSTAVAHKIWRLTQFIQEQAAKYVFKSYVGYRAVEPEPKRFWMAGAGTRNFKIVKLGP